jgi:hypothetical protein
MINSAGLLVWWYGPWAGLVCSVGHRQVAYRGDASGGVPHAVALTSAVARDVSGLYVRKGVLDAGMHAFVHGVGVRFPLRCRP